MLQSAKVLVVLDEKGIAKSVIFVGTRIKVTDMEGEVFEGILSKVVKKSFALVEDPESTNFRNFHMNKVSEIEKLK